MTAKADVLYLLSCRRDYRPWCTGRLCRKREVFRQIRYVFVYPVHQHSRSVTTYAYFLLLDSVTDLLCGDQNSVKWIDMSGRLPEDVSSLNLVEGGQDGDGNPLYVAQVEIKGATVPGK